MAYANVDTLVEFVKNNTPNINGETAMECVERAIKEAPTADVEEVKHGYWKDRYRNKYDNHIYICSVCDKAARYKFIRDELDREKAVQDLSAFCPNCGAKMDGGEK